MKILRALAIHCAQTLRTRFLHTTPWLGHLHERERCRVCVRPATDRNGASDSTCQCRSPHHACSSPSGPCACGSVSQINTGRAWCDEALFVTSRNPTSGTQRGPLKHSPSVSRASNQRSNVSPRRDGHAWETLLPSMGSGRRATRDKSRLNLSINHSKSVPLFSHNTLASSGFFCPSLQSVRSEHICRIFDAIFPLSSCVGAIDSARTTPRYHRCPTWIDQPLSNCCSITFLHQQQDVRVDMCDVHVVVVVVVFVVCVCCYCYCACGGCCYHGQYCDCLGCVCGCFVSIVVCTCECFALDHNVFVIFIH